MTLAADPIDFRIAVYATDALSAGDLERVKAVFAENYRDANVSYLEKSLGRLRYISLAEDAAGHLAGFALGESRVMDLPRLPRHNVRLAGLCCVGMAYRRKGLFGRLEAAALSEGYTRVSERILSTGRMAHPASYHNMSRNPTAVPRHGLRPTPWQQEVGMAIAEAYGSPGFDPETFVCKGTGVPIGWPVIEIEAAPEEWELFRPVDRSHGDSLLGISWAPDAPPGWV